MGLVTGPHAHTPCTHSQWAVGPGLTPQGRAVGRGRMPNPGRLTPRQEAPPPGRPPATPTARKASSERQAHPQGGKRPGHPPPELNMRSTGPGQETRRGTNRLKRPYRRPAPEPRVVRAPHRPGGGGRRVHCWSTSAATPNGHAARTRRATGASPQNAQIAWNGVPAGKENGHPDGTTCNTHREGR